MQRKTLSSKDIRSISDILKKYIDPNKQSTFIFGSVATKKMSRSSDIDIGIEGEPLSPETYFDIKNDFEESDLPYIVDVVQFSSLDKQFKKIAKKNIIPLPISK